ncbi:MAG: hypothetical protein WC637_00325 [Victivallales bacterium]|jgi:hypothetical protein
MANYKSFEEIYNAVMLAIGDLSYGRKEEVKAVVNMIYLNEIQSVDELYPLFWLLETDDTKKSKDPVTAITSITKATPPVVTSVAHGLVTGDLVTLYDSDMTEINYQTCHFTRTSADAGSLQDLSKTSIAGLGYAAAGTTGKMHHRGVTLTACKRVLLANWHGYSPGMEFLSPKEIADQTTWLDESTSRPTKMLYRKVYTAAGAEYDYLLWFQAADDAYDLHLWYEKNIDRLSATTDVPVGPPQVADAIIAGAIMRLVKNEVQVENAVVWPSVYKSNLEAIKSMNRKWWENMKQSERSGLYLP